MSFLRMEKLAKDRTELPAFPKPHELEGIVTLSTEQRRKKRWKLFHDQKGICACGCGRSMVWEQDTLATATLDHITINKMGCKKQDADSNLRVLRWDCNMAKGSRRL